MKKSTIGLIVILLMIIAIAIFVFVGNKKENTTNTTNATPVNEEENIVQNEQINEVNEIMSNEIENQVENETITENTVSSETFEESPKTAKEKAVDMVKKDWGQTNSVEFSVEGIDANGNYIVTIRDSQTTQALAFYTVNVNSGTFTKKEMN